MADEIKFKTQRIDKLSPPEKAVLGTLNIDRGGTPYTVYVANKSNWVITHIKVNGALRDLRPAIGRTCNSANCQACFDANAIAPLMTCNCNDPAFSLTLICRFDRPTKCVTGEATTTIQPDCRFAGEQMCLDAPDP